MTFLSHEDHIKAVVNGENDPNVSCLAGGKVLSQRFGVVDELGNDVPLDGRNTPARLSSGRQPICSVIISEMT